MSSASFTRAAQRGAPPPLEPLEPPLEAAVRRRVIAFTAPTEALLELLRREGEMQCCDDALLDDDTPRLALGADVRVTHVGHSGVVEARTTERPRVVVRARGEERAVALARQLQARTRSLQAALAPPPS